MNRISAFSARLRDHKSGVAMLEFAFSLPVLLLMSLSGAELTNYIVTKMRVSQVALHLADNAARIGSGSLLQAKTITETDINDLFTGAGMQAGELDLYRHGRVILSDLEPMANPNTTGKYKIVWQRCRGAKTLHESSYGDAGDTDLDGIGPDYSDGDDSDGNDDTERNKRKAIAADGGATMFVEVYYEYQPLIKTSLSPSRTMVQTASMMVRDRRDLSQIRNTENATISSCS